MGQEHPNEDRIPHKSIPRKKMKQTTVKVERGSKGFGLSLVYRGLDHFAQVGP